MPTLDQIARDFQHGRFTFADIAEPLLWIALGAGVLAGVGWATNVWRMRAQRRAKILAITDPERIRAILQKAVLHRSRMDVRFSAGEEMRTSMPCAVAEISDTHLTLELPFGVHPSPTWTGRMITAYFHIGAQQGPITYYFFRAPIATVHPSATDVPTMTVAFPQELELGQRRRHFRLDLPSADLRDLRLWTSQTTLPLDADPNHWPEPLLTFPHVGLVDISAGGVRLSVDARRLPRPQEGSSVSLETVLLFLALASPEEVPVGYFVEARLRNQFKDYATSRLLMGYEFQKFAAQPSQAGETLIWKAVNPEYGLEDLGNWIFRRHMTLYRQHAQAAIS